MVHHAISCELFFQPEHCCFGWSEGYCRRFHQAIGLHVQRHTAGQAGVNQLLARGGEAYGGAAFIVQVRILHTQVVIAVFSVAEDDFQHCAVCPGDASGAVFQQLDKLLHVVDFVEMDPIGQT